MTHSELVQRAAKWLEQNHAVVVTEMASGAILEPDAIGFKGGHWTTMVECKISRADFLANKRKGEVQMGAFRFFMTTPGLIQVAELPAKWGLLEIGGRGVSVVREAEQFYDEDRDIRGELSILVSCLRRIGQQPRPAAVSVKCYTYETKNRATLGISVS